MKAWLINFALIAVYGAVSFGLLIRDGWPEAILDGVIGGAVIATLIHWRRWPVRRPFQKRSN